MSDSRRISEAIRCEPFRPSPVSRTTSLETGDAMRRQVAEIAAQVDRIRRDAELATASEHELLLQAQQHACAAVASLAAGLGGAPQASAALNDHARRLRSQVDTALSKLDYSASR